MIDVLSFLFSMPWKIVVIFWTTWVLYIAVMGLYRAYLEDRLTVACKVLGAPLIVIGYIFDVTSNLIASLLFWHMPKEALLTAKLKRIQAEEPDGWRNKTAKWVCVNMLNPLDPTGHHC